MSQVRTFAYQIPFQEAVVGHMLADKTFVDKCKPIVKSDHFVTDQLKKIVSEIYNYVEKYDKRPDKYDLFGLFNNPEDKECINIIERCRVSAGNYSIEVVREELEKFTKFESYRDLLLQSESLYNQNKHSEAINLAHKEIAKISSINLKGEDTISFADPDAFLEMAEEHESNCLTLGDISLDEAVKSGARIKGTQPTVVFEVEDLQNPKHSMVWRNELANKTTGCLAIGDSTVVIGPTNSGKSTIVTTIIATNLLLQKDILLVFHEDDEISMVRKVVRSILGFTSEDMRNIKNDPRLKDLFCKAFALCNQKLTMLPILDPTQLYVENVINQVKFLNEKQKQKTGKGFDMVVDDYPGLLHSKTMRSMKAEKRNDMRECYLQFMALAKSEKFHALLPAQSNRIGSKKQFSKGKDLVTSEDIGEAYVVTNDADNVITINRRESDVGKEQMMLFVTKTRSGEKYFKFWTRTNFARGRTHGFGLKSTLERSHDGFSNDYVDSLLGTSKKTDDIVEKTNQEEVKNDLELKKEANEEQNINNS